MHTYSYDANGNISFEVINDGSKETYKTYLYDSQNRLIRANDSELDMTITYEYDARGNITNYTVYDYTANNNDLKLSTAVPYNYAYNNTTWKDLATNIHGTAISYDAIGNPLNWTGGANLIWENGRQLKSIILSGAFAQSYTYNGDGLRLSKWGERNTKYIIVDGTYLGERTTIGGTTYFITYIYGVDGSVTGIEINGTPFYFVKNLQGDVTAIITATGDIVAKYAYNAYGRIMSVTSANGTEITADSHIARLNPFRYRGYMYDEETGFYYLRSRYYDPEVGRFLNADDTSILTLSEGPSTDKNLFAYCDNNPIMRVDSDGQAWFSAIKRKFENVKETSKKLASDIIKFDLNNTSEKNVLESNYISAYKGKLVFRINGDRSGSLGAIFLTYETNDRTYPEDVIRHEYGHTKQLEELGLGSYITNIFIPSWLELSDDYYYDRPWEVTADYFGGVESRVASEEKLALGMAYLKSSALRKKLPSLVSFLKRPT